MRRCLLVISIAAMFAGACGSFGEATPVPGTGSEAGSEAGAADGAPDGPVGIPADGATGVSCNPLASWTVDFESPLPGDYSIPGTNNVAANVAGGKFVTGVSIPEGGGQYRGLFRRDLDVPSGVDHLELSFVLFAGAAPALSNFEVGCSLYMRPDPGNPAQDRRFVVRTDSKDMSFQWSETTPSKLASNLGPAPSGRSFKLRLQAAPPGTSFDGNLSFEGIDYPASLDLGSVAKAIRLECGLVFGTAQMAGADSGVRGYAVSLDNVLLSVCARP